MPAHVIRVGASVATREQRTGKLCAAAFAVNVMIRVDEFASSNAVTHGFALRNSVDQAVGHVVRRLGCASQVAESLCIAV